MPEIKIRILSTAPLPDEAHRLVADTHAVLDEISLIRTRILTDEKTKARMQELAGLTITAVFTSANAVEAAEVLLENNKPRWNVFAIGKQTKEKAAAVFGQNAVNGNAPDALTLAQQIYERNPAGPLIFFCGNQRRDELPDYLHQAGKPAEEFIVYQTEETPVQINNLYEAVLFFSPSGVRSFFRLNPNPAQTVLVAIGQTTADEIKKFSTNQILIASEPVKTAVLKTALEYFKL